MRVHRIAVLVATLTIVLALPFTAQAGGWSTIQLDSPLTGPAAGQNVSIGFTVLQHGQTPLGGLRPLVKLHHPATDERQTFQAVESGPKGHYVANITFPRSGAWEWEVNAFEGDHPQPALEVLPAPETASSTRIAEQPVGFGWPLLLGAALATVVLAGLAYSRLAVRSS